MLQNPCWLKLSTYADRPRLLSQLKQTRIISRLGWQVRWLMESACPTCKTKKKFLNYRILMKILIEMILSNAMNWCFNQRVRDWQLIMFFWSAIIKIVLNYILYAQSASSFYLMAQNMTNLPDLHQTCSGTLNFPPLI